MNSIHTVTQQRNGSQSQRREKNKDRERESARVRVVSKSTPHTCESTTATPPAGFRFSVLPSHIPRAHTRGLTAHTEELTSSTHAPPSLPLHCFSSSSSSFFFLPSFVPSLFPISRGHPSRAVFSISHFLSLSWFLAIDEATLSPCFWVHSTDES